MGHARYVGRVGALAVALGLGSAIATMPGVAVGQPADPDSQVSVSDASEEPAAVDDAASDGADDDRDSALDDADDLTDATTLDETVNDVVPDDFADRQESSRDRTTTGAVVDDVVPAAGERTLLRERLQPASDEDVIDASALSALSAFSTPVEATEVTEVTEVFGLAGAGGPPTAVVPAPAPDLEELLEEPHTYLIGMTTHVVDAVLELLLAPLGPGSPIQSPILWSMLAFVRDEFTRIVFGGSLPGTVTSSLVEAPNLLVNPGAELGDPALSGYSAVTVPGWAVTGTPTVIEFGTLRRFPVPTPSPGPVLPRLLAFPSHDGPIATPPGSGKQFFGGGPVADSTLSQTVDLSAAADAIDNRPGGVRYELSGDLGGFLIDPSRASVTVDFFDGNGVKLGSGAMKPVTAWDRLFATGFLHRSVSGTIPPGTRTAAVVVSFDDRNPVLGNYNNAYADNLSFKVDADGLVAAPLTPPASTVGELDHVFMVYLENKGVSQIVGSPNAPYINGLIDRYGYASNYFGVTHPSDPNYYPIIGGSDFGFNYNCPSNCFPVGTPNLVDDIESAGLTWAGYAEGGGGYTSPTDRLPFLAFADVYNDAERVATHLFDISQMEHDLADPATAPNFVWFAADDDTNMEGPTDFPLGILHWALGFLNPAHQYNVAAGDAWLERELGTIMDSATWNDPNRKSAVFVTFDEDYNNITTGVGNEGNHIVMVVIPSPGAVAAGMRDGAFVVDSHYNHYSLLRTIEEALGLSPLTNNDEFAVPMNEFWT
ncbi:alkaline phosphatase family protein [Mycolicibacterium sp. XJ1819]